MTDPTQNSRNRANKGSLAGTFREILGKFLSDVDDMLPAVVIAYDRDTNRATVRPLIQLLKTDGTLLDRAEVASVPVLNIGGGNGVLSFPIQPQDLGWIKASDRDITLFLQSEAPADIAPNTLRKHDFSDSLFIPDAFKRWTIQTGDEDSIVLQTLDGLERISFDAVKGFRIHSAVKIALTAPEVAIESPAVSVTSVGGGGGGTMVIKADIDHTGDQDTTGDVVASSGTSNISLVDHTHSQDNDNDGDTEVETNAPTPV